MSKDYQKYSEAALDFMPYAQIIAAYFGFPFLEIGMTLNEAFRAQKSNKEVAGIEVDLYVAISREEIREKLAVFSLPNDDLDALTEILFRTGNLFHRGVYAKYQDMVMSEWIGDEKVNAEIEEDVIRLYSFMRSHQDESEIKLLVGKDAVVLKDPYRWFQYLINNKLAPQIAGIDRRANSLEKKRAGRPSSRQDLNVFISGLDQMFHNMQVVKELAPHSLCEFIRWFLVRMEYVKENDKTINTNWIKAQLNNIRKSGKDYRYELAPLDGGQNIDDASGAPSLKDWLCRRGPN